MLKTFEQNRPFNLVMLLNPDFFNQAVLKRCRGASQESSTTVAERQPRL
jgi:hypothetical protein